MNAQDWAILEYCAEEVRRQRDTPEHVTHMVRAWDFALAKSALRRWPQYEDVLVIGHLVKPSRNLVLHPRKINVQVGNSTPPDYDQVPRLLRLWVDAVHDGRLNADEAYLEFEEIHPFADGNGRSGKVLYNWLRGTLTEPVWPPNFWGIANP